MWAELRTDLRGARFNLKNIMRRLKRLGADPWEGFFGVRQRLPAVRRGRSTRRA
jgi:bifunctional non-homologous end joining protein LigD